MSSLVPELPPSSSTSAGKGFQIFLRNRPVTHLSLPGIFEFLSYMFHTRKRGVPTISICTVALVDPLWFGIHLDIWSRVWDLMKRGSFLQHPPPKHRRIFWSLSKVLTFFRGPDFTVAPDLHHRLQKAFFLMTMVSGLRTSQLHNLVHHPAWLVFTSDRRRVFLAPSPKFLGKNEREGHVLTPLLLRGWMDGHNHHLLCPVEALQQYEYVIVTPHRTYTMVPGECEGGTVVFSAS